MSPRREVLDQDEADIRQKILAMGEAVDLAIPHSLQAIVSGDLDQARLVLDLESQLNRGQIKIQQECVLTIATQQPVAKDLRTVMADSRIAVELERVGDHTANMARRVIAGFRLKEPFSASCLTGMVELSRKMLAEGMEAYAEQSLDKLRTMEADRMTLDSTRLGQVSNLMALATSSPEFVESAIELIQFIHRLERIGDHATNIAQQIIYLVKGEVASQGKRLA